MPLHFHRIHLTLRVTIDDEVLAHHSVASPEVVAGELAREVAAAARAAALGYYPAIDYFRSQGGIDTELLEAAENIGWLACNLASDEVRRRLRPVFSSISFLAVQSLAHTLPAVRPGQPNALTRLAEHYTPSSVKLDLEVTLIQKQAEAEGLERFARQVASRWLKHSFKSLEVTAHRLTP